MTIAEVDETAVPAGYQGWNLAGTVCIPRAQLDELVKDLYQVGMDLLRLGGAGSAAPEIAARARETVDRAITRIHTVASRPVSGDLDDGSSMDGETDTIEWIDAAHSALRAWVIMEEAQPPVSGAVGAGSI